MGCEKKSRKRKTGVFKAVRDINLMLIDFFMQECVCLSDQIKFNVYSSTVTIIIFICWRQVDILYAIILTLTVPNYTTDEKEI